MHETKPQLLVVDDEQDTCANLADIFTDLGYDVDVAYDGFTALERVKQKTYDIAILDLKMPGMDGLEAIRNFHQVLPRVPIIAMSGFMFRAASALTPDFLAMASKFGAACSLPKPFKPEELLGAVQLCLPPNAPVA